MFGLSLLIIVAAAILGTAMAAMGLRVFFHILEPSGSTKQIAPALTETSPLGD